MKLVRDLSSQDEGQGRCIGNRQLGDLYTSRGISRVVYHMLGKSENVRLPSTNNTPARSHLVSPSVRHHVAKVSVESSRLDQVSRAHAPEHSMYTSHRSPSR